MKKLTKEDFKITELGTNKYGILIKTEFLFIFSYWTKLNYQNKNAIEFDSFDEAIDFINLAT